jgi:hypothetical protein
MGTGWDDDDNDNHDDDDAPDRGDGVGNVLALDIRRGAVNAAKEIDQYW